MADLCPTCKREHWARGVEYQEGKHCPDSPDMGHAVRDEVSCLRIGLELRDLLLQRGTDNLRRLLKSIDHLYEQTEETAEAEG